MPRLAALLLLVVLWLCTGAAHGAPSKVVVLQPAAATERVQEAVRRTEGELAAEGFAVVPRPLAAGDLRALLMKAAEDENAIAAIAVLPQAEGAAADVWVSDRVTDKTVIRTVRVDQVPMAERPRALAIRAVELLRASLVEVVVPVGPPPPPPAPADLRAWLVPPTGPLEGVALQLGVGMLAGFDGISVAAGPSARLGWTSALGLGARVSWLGPAFGARPRGDEGTASVRQELVTLDLVYAPKVEAAGFTPVVWAGAGAYHLHARGELTAPLLGRSDDLWTAAFVAGAGLGYRLTPRITALLDVSALVTAPRAVVTLFGEPLGSAGRPSLLGDLGVAVRF